MSRGHLDHIAIAVANLEEALRFYTDALGLAYQDIETIADQGVRLAKLAVGDSHLELLEPLSAKSPVGKFLQQRGAGLHHICLEVDDIAARLSELKSKGVQLINESATYGAGGAQIAFIHPKATGGVLIELSQPVKGRS